MSEKITLDQLATQCYSTVEAKANGANKISLGIAERVKLLSRTLDNSLIYNLIPNDTILSADELKLEFVKLQASNWSKKTEVGTGKADKWRISAPVSVYWREPLKTYETYLAVEKNINKALNVGKKIAKKLTEFSRMFERTSIAEIENKVIADNKQIEKDLMNMNGDELYAELVAKATELTQTFDTYQGIDLIDPADIIILVKPTLLDKVARVGLTGNRAEVTFNSGAYSVSTIGGYKIMSCPFLSKFDAIVTTNFIGAGATQIIAINSGKVGDLSNDEGLYVEAKFAFNVIWDNLTIGYAKTTQTQHGKGELITKPENATEIKDEPVLN